MTLLYACEDERHDIILASDTAVSEYNMGYKDHFGFKWNISQKNKFAISAAGSVKVLQHIMKINSIEHFEEELPGLMKYGETTFSAILIIRFQHSWLAQVFDLTECVYPQETRMELNKPVMIGPCHLGVDHFLQGYKRACHDKNIQMDSEEILSQAFNHAAESNTVSGFERKLLKFNRV